MTAMTVPVPGASGRFVTLLSGERPVTVALPAPNVSGPGPHARPRILPVTPVSAPTPSREENTHA